MGEHGGSSVELLRLITAGSVDDGKSTLIGRILFDARALQSDQLSALSRARHARTISADAQLDLALITDGLESEREQGITIDVAYRYFRSAVRRYILADAPGHEQYTRNLVTGASQADVGIILIDASKPGLAAGSDSLPAQTLRHTAILRLLRLSHLVFVVSKMDLIAFDEGVFKRIEALVQRLRADLGIESGPCIPVSALLGDGVTYPSIRAPWYRGPSLMQYLDALSIPQRAEPGLARRDGALVFPVQVALRHAGNSQQPLRAYLGTILRGCMFPGQEVVAYGSGAYARVKAVYPASESRLQPTGPGGASDPAPAPGIPIPSDQDRPSIPIQAATPVAVVLDRPIDLERGDMLGSQPPATPESSRAAPPPGAPQAPGSSANTTEPHALRALATSPEAATELLADFCWLDNQPLDLRRRYALRHTTRLVKVMVTAVEGTLNLETMRYSNAGKAVGANTIGVFRIALQQPIFAETFRSCRALGAFVLIDEVRHRTLAAGMIREIVRIRDDDRFENG